MWSPKQTFLHCSNKIIWNLAGKAQPPYDIHQATVVFWLFMKCFTVSLVYSKAPSYELLLFAHAYIQIIQSMCTVTDGTESVVLLSIRVFDFPHSTTYWSFTRSNVISCACGKIGKTVACVMNHLVALSMQSYVMIM